jgi:hypothetical protein
MIDVNDFDDFGLSGLIADLERAHYLLGVAAEWNASIRKDFVSSRRKCAPACDEAQLAWKRKSARRVGLAEASIRRCHGEIPSEVRRLKRILSSLPRNTTKEPL